MLIKKEYQEQKLTHISRSGWTCRRNGFFRAILPFICEIRSPYLKNVIQFFETLSVAYLEITPQVEFGHLQ